MKNFSSKLVIIDHPIIHTGTQVLYPLLGSAIATNSIVQLQYSKRVHFFSVLPSCSLPRRDRGICIPCPAPFHLPRPPGRGASAPRPGRCEPHCWQQCRHEAASSHDSALRLASNQCAEILTCTCSYYMYMHV